MPPEPPRGGGRLLTPAHFQIQFTQEKKFVEVIYSRGDGGGPYSKTVIILHGKLLCKGEPYRFIGKLDPLLQAKIKKFTILLNKTVLFS